MHALNAQFFMASRAEDGHGDANAAYWTPQRRVRILLCRAEWCYYQRQVRTRI